MKTIGNIVALIVIAYCLYGMHWATQQQSSAPYFGFAIIILLAGCWFFYPFFNKLADKLG